MTDQEEYEASQRLSRESLFALVERAPFGLYIVDSDFRIAKINADSQERAFRNVNPAVGRDFTEAMNILWPAEVAAAVIKEFRHTLDSGEPYYSHDYTYPRADIDDVESYEWQLHRIAMPDGRNGVVCYYFDSTELREAEQALRRNEAWLRGQKEAFQASVNDVPLETSLEILVHGAVEYAGSDTRVAFYLVNAAGDAVNHVTGMGEEYGKAIGDFPIGPASIACGLCVHTGQPVIYPDVELDPAWAPYLHICRQFDYRACWSFPMRGAGGKVIGTLGIYSREPRETTSRDMEVAVTLTLAAEVIVARHQATQEQIRVEQVLRDADRRKDEFLAMLAHELRNPLGVIRNAVRILRHRDTDTQSIQVASDILDRQVEYMVRQIDGLLDVSRVSRSKIELRMEHVDLVRVVNNAIETVRPLCDSLAHELTISLPAGPVHVYGDAIRLTQVIGNLLNNACKFTDPHGRVWLTLAQEGTQAVIRVRDSGIGLAAAELGRIFELFAQVDSSLERSRDGLGLGLTLARQLVDMHGGGVEAFSEGVGQGSEFVVRLPLSAQMPPEARDPIFIERTAAVSRRVLVVDDNPDAAESLAILLARMGHVVDVAHDGIEAAERTLTFQADIVLLDIGLPLLNGYEAARLIRQQQQKDLMLVALTGWGRQEDRQKSTSAGFDAHLVKPIDLDALTALITGWRAN